MCSVHTSSAILTAYYIGVALVASSDVAFSVTYVLNIYMSCRSGNGDTQLSNKVLIKYRPATLFFLTKKWVWRVLWH